MFNGLLSYNDYVRDLIDAQITSPSNAASPARVRTRIVAQRTQQASGTLVLRVDLGSSRSIDCISLIGTAWDGASAAFGNGIIKLSTTAAHDGDVDSRVIAPAKHVLVALNAPVNARFCEVSIPWADTGGTRALGRLWIGTAFRLPFDKGWELEPDYLIDDIRTIGAQTYRRIGKPVKRVSWNVGRATLAQAIGTIPGNPFDNNVLALLAAAAQREVIAAPKVQQAHSANQTVVYGLLHNTTALQHKTAAFFNIGLAVEETL